MGVDRSRVRFLLNLSPVHYDRDGYRGMLDDIRRCDDVGIDEITFSEHVVLPGGNEIPPPESQWPETLALIAAGVAVTERIAFSTGIMLAALRPAPLLAKQIATIDHLAEGRVSYGVGASYVAGEYEAFGLDFDQRGALLTDVIAACRAMWAEPMGASYHGPTVNFDDLYAVPGPYTPGGPPILFAGKYSPRNVRRIVELGNGWLPAGFSADGFKTEMSELKEAFAAAGRDPETLMLHGMPPAETASGGRPEFYGEKAVIAKSFDALDGILENNPHINQFGIGSRFFADDSCADDMPAFIDELGRLIADWRS